MIPKLKVAFEKDGRSGNGLFSSASTASSGFLLIHFHLFTTAELLKDSNNISGYDIGCIANIQAPIYQAFGNLPLLPWVALSYVAIGSASVPLIRKFLDVCDLRWQVPGYAAFLFVGATVSGSAQSVEAVIIGRCLTGLGGAGIFQLVLAYLLLCGTPAEYSRVTAACASCWAIGLTLGPIIAAGFAENVTWRWVIILDSIQI